MDASFSLTRQICSLHARLRIYKGHYFQRYVPAARRSRDVSRVPLRAERSWHATGSVEPFEESFDSPINFHVTLFLEGIHSERLGVITVRNVLSYWTSFTGVLEDAKSRGGP